VECTLRQRAVRASHRQRLPRSPGVSKRDRLGWCS
jgi:hypothetical protein